MATLKEAQLELPRISPSSVLEMIQANRNGDSTPSERDLMRQRLEGPQPTSQETHIPGCSRPVAGENWENIDAFEL